MSDTNPAAMTYRFLGRSGLKVSTLSLGSFLTYGANVKDPDVAYKCVKAAYDAGINTFDTAELYGAGQAEIDIGAAIKRLNVKRSDLVVITKLFWGGDGPNDRGLSRKHVIEGLQASLKRLQMDYVDVVFAHRPDPDTPMEEIVRAFNHCIDRGWAFYWGTSEWSAQQITHANGVAERLGLVGPSCEQPQYNCFTRERVEKEYAPLYEHFGLGTTIWAPLDSGILTGKYNEGIPSDSRFAANDKFSEFYRKGLASEEGKVKIERVRTLTKVAERIGATTAQLAIAWCLKNEKVSTVIIGASRLEQLQHNVKSLAFVPKLTPEIMAEIEGILANKPKDELNMRTDSMA